MKLPKYAVPDRLAHLLGLSLLVVSCVTSRDVMAPDGSLAHYIECPRSQDRCMDEAAELCPRGYDVIGSGGQHGALVQANAQTGIATVTPTYRGNMTVKCHRPAPATSPIVRTLPDPPKEPTPTASPAEAVGRCHELGGYICSAFASCAIETGGLTQEARAEYVHTCLVGYKRSVDCSRKSLITGNPDVCEAEVTDVPCSMFTPAAGLPMPASCRDLFK